MYWWIGAAAVIALFIGIGLVLAPRGEARRGRGRSPDALPEHVSRRRSYTIAAVLLVLATTAFAYYHWPQLAYSIWMVPVIIVSFVWMVFLLLSAHTNQVYIEDPPTRLRTTVVIPVFNEDPATLALVLESISAQTQTPDVVFVVEDGSHEDFECRAVFEEWAERSAAPAGILARYHYQANAGKREAQAVAFRAFMDRTDIFVTIDSDTVLDPLAIRQGLKPFADERVMSVAGLLLDLNRAKWKVRVIGLGFVSSFTNGRAAWSAWKSVAVNCGGLAFYRTEVIRENLIDYLSQRVFGSIARFGDDRMLAQFAGLHGRTVFQETAAAYTLMPERLGHLTRQRIRWWKSFWWGGLWLLRKQSPFRAVWWLVLSQYVTFVLNAIVFPAAVLIYPIIHQQFPWQMIVYVLLLSYVRTARTLVVRRPDVSGLRQVLEFIVLAPISTLFTLYLGTVLQYWALFTLGSSSWGTRKRVEVALS